MSYRRREFIKGAGAMGLGSALVPVRPRMNASGHQTPKDAPEPSPAQKKWMDLKFGLFIHFGINTYYDVEWSDGTLDPVKYNPTQLDTDQWCRAAQISGMRYVVLVAKHHDGFCNWPTKFTDYSVAATPFKKDVVKAVTESARKYNLKVGLYYSLWDRHEPTHDRDEYAYVEFVKNQLTELLTGYGRIVEVWFDGFWKKQQSGWKDKAGEKTTAEEFIKAWRYEGAYRWQMDHLYQFIKRLHSAQAATRRSTASSTS